MKPVTIIIADNHKLLREALKFFLNSIGRFNIVADCHSALSLEAAVLKFKPDVILLSLNLHGLSGKKGINTFREIYPDVKILAIAQFILPSLARKLMLRDIDGYLTKDCTRDEVIEGILTVHSGKKYMCSHIKEMFEADYTSGHEAFNKLNKLSLREMEIVELLRNGLFSWEIAETLSISQKTVQAHRFNILRKLNLKNTASLINYFSKHFEKQ